MNKFKFLIVLFLSLSLHVFAQDEKPKSIDEIAKELSNPISLTASLVLQGTFTGWNGSAPLASEQHSSNLVFLPTLPFKVGKYNLTVRPSFPVAAAPFINSNGEWDTKRGFGDIVILSILGRVTKGGLLYGFGPTVIAPTASAPELGADQWQVGPVLLLGVLKKWGVVGMLWQHWWGVGDPPAGSESKNLGTTQFFYWFGAGNGWQIGGSPIATANYLSASDVDFSVPLNLGFAKTLLAGKTPLKLTLQGQYFVTRPDKIGPSWGVFFQITPVINVPWSK